MPVGVGIQEYRQKVLMTRSLQIELPEAVAWLWQSLKPRFDKRRIGLATVKMFAKPRLLRFGV